MPVRVWYSGAVRGSGVRNFRGQQAQKGDIREKLLVMRVSAGGPLSEFSLWGGRRESCTLTSRFWATIELTPMGEVVSRDDRAFLRIYEGPLYVGRGCRPCGTVLLPGRSLSSRAVWGSYT